VARSWRPAACSRSRSSPPRAARSRGSPRTWARCPGAQTGTAQSS